MPDHPRAFAERHKVKALCYLLSWLDERHLQAVSHAVFIKCKAEPSQELLEAYYVLQRARRHKTERMVRKEEHRVTRA